MKFIQVNDLLTPTYHSKLFDMVNGMNGFPWYFLSEDVSYSTRDVMFGDTPLLDMPEDEKSIGFTHVLLDQDNVESPWLPRFEPLLYTVQDALPCPVNFLRVRLALQLNNGKVHHNAPHTDSEKDHYAALYYLHDSTGDTVFFEQYDDPKDGSVEERWYKARTQKYTEHMRVRPQANKLFVFDGHRFHSSSNPVGDSKWRIVLNLNFTCDEDLFATI